LFSPHLHTIGMIRNSLIGRVPRLANFRFLCVSSFPRCVTSVLRQRGFCDKSAENPSAEKQQVLASVGRSEFGAQPLRTCAHHNPRSEAEIGT
jgi:hypothetical protein